MKKLLFIACIAILFYTRFVNIEWGLPYPMHPDERNMAVAVQGLNCNFKFQISNFKLTECLNPHFFAYGQLPLYLAYGGIQIYHFISGAPRETNFNEATLALRTISAVSSILLVIVLFKTIELVLGKKHFSFGLQLLAFSFLIFQPYAIQLAHFGTTESLLLLLYVLIIYYSLKLLTANNYPLTALMLLGLFSGLALGTKISSILFLGVPILVIVLKTLSFRAISDLPAGKAGKSSERSERKNNNASLDFSVVFQSRKLLRNDMMSIIFHLFLNLFTYLSITLFFFILSSPQNFLNWNDFISSMKYESTVGLGIYLPFYTRQFIGTVPILFQFQHILPYVLGWPQFILSIFGFVLLPWRLKQQVAELKGPTTRAKSARQQAWQLLSTGGKLSILTESVVLNPYNILRFALIFSFLPPSFFFAKWTRFIAPSFPLFSLFALLFILHLYIKWKKQIFMKYVLSGFVILSLLPGISALSIYMSPDIRFTASEWIYKNIPPNSKILSETANVIDIPIPSPNSRVRTHSYLLNSFNFYDLDSDRQMKIELSEALNDAEYIIIPSRRIFKNHSNNFFPFVSNYYENLFSGKSGFEKVAEFSSFPKITLFGKTLIEFPDEEAEETWTVFDHPVIRIYKKSQKSEGQLQQSNLNFSDYKTIDFQLLDPQTFRLLIADTPEKWAKGLMYVKRREDIGGFDGMIFTFPDSLPRTFWNKNTLSHLTLYWIANKKIVGISDLPSITETRRVITVSSPSPADTVIEIIQ